MTVHGSARNVAPTGSGPGYDAAVAHTESLSVTVDAPAADVLAFLRDIDNQMNWFPGNVDSEVLERDADGLPARVTTNVAVSAEFPSVA